jgi:hypothetical protein
MMILMQLPLVPDTVFGARGSGWERALRWLRSLDLEEVDAWFKGKRRTRLGEHGVTLCSNNCG